MNIETPDKALLCTRYLLFYSGSDYCKHNYNKKLRKVMFHRVALEAFWALIFIAAMVAWMLIERMVGLHSVYIEHHPLFTNIFAVIAIAIYVLALRHKRERFYDGVMSWQQGFYAGLVITLIIALLSPLTQWVIHTLITPYYLINAATYAVENDVMTASQAAEYFNLTAYIIQAFFGALILGVVTSAVVAFFLRTRK